VAGRRSGASEEKEGERGLIHPQDGVLLAHHVLGRALRCAEVYVTQRAMIRIPLPPCGPLRQHLSLQRFDGVQSARPGPGRHRRNADDAQRGHGTDVPPTGTATSRHHHTARNHVLVPIPGPPQATALDHRQANKKRPEGIASGLSQRATPLPVAYEVSCRVRAERACPISPATRLRIHPWYWVPRSRLRGIRPTYSVGRSAATPAVTACGPAAGMTIA
jgi:hypothetical protein